MIVALIVTIPVVLFVAALVWFLNISGIYTVFRETRRRQTIRERIKVTAESKQ